MLMADCQGTEIAAHFSMHPNTFYERVTSKYKVSFTEYSSLKRQAGDALLKAAQFSKAVGAGKGDNTMLIWLGKVRLGQRDNDASLPPNDKKLDEIIDHLKGKADGVKPETETELSRSE